MRAAVGVLVPLSPQAGPPDSTALGRAALAVDATVVFGEVARDGKMDGYVASAAGWVAVSDVPVDAVHDRYPSRAYPDRYRAAVDGLAGVPFANPPSIVALCRDKLASQEHLAAAGVDMPEVEADPARFGERLATWGRAFLKPRYGSFGIGVRCVRPGDALPARVESLYGETEPAILQRAVPPPAGLAGACARVLVQREGDGFRVAPTALRTSATDPIVSVHRGADVAHASVDGLDALAVRVAEALARSPDGDWLVEVGLDVVIDPAGRPRLIEVNGRPRGRLARLADGDPATWAHAATEAARRPLAWLAARVGR